MYKTILFDMDGTIADSFDVIAECASYALGVFGITVERSELRRFVGPPLKYSFMSFMGFSELQAITAIDYYSKRYNEIGSKNIKIYEGIPALLKALNDKGVTLAVASTKPITRLIELCEEHNLSHLFKFLGGSDASVNRTEKAQVIEHVLENLNVKNRSEVLLVGDRCFDLEGAEKCGIDAVGVLYGFGNLQDFGNLPRVAVLPTVSKLRTYLLEST